MVIHNRVDDAMSVGKRDAATGRYIPIGGGSRTRLPVYDDPRIPRYLGFVGINASQSEEIYTLPALYAELDDSASVPVAQGSEIETPVAEANPKEDEGLAAPETEKDEGLAAPAADLGGSAGVQVAQGFEMAEPVAEELPNEDDDSSALYAEEEDSAEALAAEGSEIEAPDAEWKPKEDDVLFI